MTAPTDQARPAGDWQGGRSSGPRSRLLWIASISTIILGSAASILPSTAVNVAVPDFERVFHASLTDVQWILTAYLLGLAAVIPTSGWLADRFGTRRVYLASLLTFSAASLLCGVAWNVHSEIGFRVLQGAAGGAIQPVGMAFLTRSTPPERRGRMMATLGVPVLLAPALGPTIGGFLIQNFDWRLVFWVNVPLALLSFAVGYFVLRSEEVHREHSLDVVGLLLASPAVIALLFGLTEAAQNGWGSYRVLLPVGVGALLMAAFVWWELRQAQPLLDLRVLQDRGYAAAMSISVTVAIALFGAIFLIPVFMQQVQGYSTLDAGLLLGAQGLTAAVLMPISGNLTDRIGPKPVILTGVLILVASTAWLTTVGPSTSKATWIAMLALRGAGMAFSMMPAFAAAYLTIPATAISRATALANTMQRVASSFGIALLATVVASRVSAHVGHAASAAAARQGAALGFDDTLWVAAAIAALAIPGALLLRRAPKREPAGQTTEPDPARRVGRPA